MEQYIVIMLSTCYACSIRFHGSNHVKKLAVVSSCMLLTRNDWSVEVSIALQNPKHSQSFSFFRQKHGSTLSKCRNRTELLHIEIPLFGSLENNASRNFIDRRMFILRSWSDNSTI